MTCTIQTICTNGAFRVAYMASFKAPSMGIGRHIQLLFFSAWALLPWAEHPAVHEGRFP